MVIVIYQKMMGSQSLKKCPTTASRDFLVCDPMTLVLEMSDPFQIISIPNQTHKKEIVIVLNTDYTLIGLCCLTGKMLENNENVTYKMPK